MHDDTNGGDDTQRDKELRNVIPLRRRDGIRRDELVSFGSPRSGTPEPSENHEDHSSNESGPSPGAGIAGSFLDDASVVDTAQALLPISAGYAPDAERSAPAQQPARPHTELAAARRPSKPRRAPQRLPRQWGPARYLAPAGAGAVLIVCLALVLSTLGGTSARPTRSASAPRVEQSSNLPLAAIELPSALAHPRRPSSTAAQRTRKAPRARRRAVRASGALHGNSPPVTATATVVHAQPAVPTSYTPSPAPSAPVSSPPSYSPHPAPVSTHQPVFGPRGALGPGKCSQC